MVLMSRGALCKGRHCSTDWSIPQISVYFRNFMLVILILIANMRNDRNANISLLFKGNSRNSKLWLFRGISPSKSGRCYRYRQFKSLANKNPACFPSQSIDCCLAFRWLDSNSFPPNSTHRLFVVMEEHCVLCPVRTEYLCIMSFILALEGLTHCGRVTQICVFNTAKLGTSASSP